MRKIKFRIWDKTYLYFVKISEDNKYYISSNGDIEIGFVYENDTNNLL